MKPRRRLVLPFVISFSFVAGSNGSRVYAQDAPADGVSSDSMAGFTGTATGQTEDSAPPPDSMNADTIAGNPPTTEDQAVEEEQAGEDDDDAPPPAEEPLKDGPTYKKFFVPVENREREARQKRAREPRAHPEHFGVAGHRRRRQPIIESHNAETVIGRDTLEHFVEGTNALEALALSTPGASFSSSDAQGTDSVNNTFYLRG